jgi:hypothetical protein
VTVIAVVVLIGALAFVVGRKVRPTAAAGSAWYYDTATGEFFTDKTTRIPPFKRDNGNEAVRAHFFTCGECTPKMNTEGGQRFIGYYEKYTDEMRDKLQESTQAMMLYDMAFQGRLYSSDGKTWVPAEQPEGTAITADLQQKCPPKSLRYCPPE